MVMPSDMRKRAEALGLALFLVYFLFSRGELTAAEASDQILWLILAKLLREAFPEDAKDADKAAD
jgi:hypothetical protein